MSDQETDAPLEEELRALLRRVDEVEPPRAPDFAARAMAAARETPDETSDEALDESPVEEPTTSVVHLGRERRQRRQPRPWMTAVVGAAAALVVGVAVVQALPDSGSSASSGTAAGAPQRDTSQPESAAAGGDAATGTPTPTGRAAPVVPRATPDTLATIGGEVVADGRSAPGSDVAAASSELSALLGASPYDTTFTGLVVRDDPQRVEVHLTSFAEPVLAAVSARLPAGTPITYIQSYFSVAACRTTLADVQGDLPGLGSGGPPLGDPRCDLTGRVALTAGGTPSADQRARITTAYGATVVIVDAEGRAL